VAFLGEIADIPFPDQDLPQLQAARRDARLMADQTTAAWMDWLEAEAEHHPVFILLEDLHWCDFASVNYMDAALRILPKKPVMVLALARPELDERFYGLWRDRRVQRMSLGPLGKRAAEDMIRRVLGQLAPEKLAWLLDHAQGNPFYLEELCRTLSLGGDLAAIPDTVLGTVQVRFDSIGEGCKLVLRAASIFGQSFTAAGVKALIDDMNDEDVDRWLEILVDKEILFSRPMGNHRQHVFRHALLHQAAYAMLTPKDEVSGHHLAADFLERSGEREAIVLADHYEKGQQPVKAVQWLRVAANQAMEVDDLATALTRVDRGVKLGAKGDDLAELRVVESEARYWTGEYVEAERAGREARRCEDPKLALRALGTLLEALGMQAKYEDIAGFADLLGEKPPQPELLNEWFDCKHCLASHLAGAGQTELRTRTLDLFEILRDQLDPVLSARVDSMKAHLAKAVGQPGEAFVLWKRAAESFEHAGYRRAATEMHGNVGSCLTEVGQLEEAEAQMRGLLAIAERMGLTHMLGGTYYMLSNILAYKGSTDDAREFAKRAIDWCSGSGERHFLTYARLYASVIEHNAGDFRAAQGHARIALGMVQDNSSLRPFARALLARALLRQASLSDAILLAAAAYNELEELGEVYDGEAMIRLAWAECLLAKPDRSAAQSVLARAVQKIEKSANSFSIEGWRESFLTRIPEHRLLIELNRSINQ
jgi:eukaryotic-like serine/threonine-protein kinase